jgi:hypothetical protein
MTGQSLGREGAARNPHSLNFLQVRSAFKTAVEPDAQSREVPLVSRPLGTFVPETFVSIGLQTFVPLPTPSAWLRLPARPVNTSIS